MKQSMDYAALGVAVATLANWLPPIAALLSIIWLAMQIGEKLYRWLRKP